MVKQRWAISIGGVGVIGLLFLFFFSPLTSAKKDQETFLSYSGIVQQTEFDLGFKLAGRLQSIELQEGQHIKKGQLVAQLEANEWEAKVNQARAAVEIAEANLQKAMRSVGLTEQTGAAKIEQAQAAVHMAQAKLDALKHGVRKEEIAQFEAKVKAAKEASDQAEDLLQRTTVLYEQGAVAQSKVDEAKLQAEQTKAQAVQTQLQLEIALSGARPEEIEAAKQQVEQARGGLKEALTSTAKVDLTHSDVRLAKGQLQQAMAQLQEAETYFSYTKLLAPADGVVTKKLGKTGDMVSSGMTTLSMADPFDKWVTYYVFEQDLDLLKIGQKVSVVIPAIGQEILGEVKFINPAPQFAARKATNYLSERDVRSFEVKIQLVEKVEQVYAGMTAEWSGVPKE
ncbi:HlyD family secretion protein [Ammoniphilus sp. YIM 78166]|uniref:HlyD family secretion protein n=1 Tax=Ammoniphilus sp. YIM 78166 TaxID=1644106 RepID=UPI00106F5A4B|nr:efflux RND transporter periplasmic adaptor subunit [Ammoniphilus sp. YIM 78166]